MANGSGGALDRARRDLRRERSVMITIVRIKERSISVQHRRNLRISAARADSQSD